MRRIVATRDILPTYMHDELDNISQDYLSVPHKDWCELMSTIVVKDNSKISAAQVKRLAASKAAPANYDFDMSARVTRKKKARNVVLLDRKQKSNNTFKHSGDQ